LAHLKFKEQENLDDMFLGIDAVVGRRKAGKTARN